MKKLIAVCIVVIGSTSLMAQSQQSEIKQLKNQVRELEARIDSLESSMSALALIALASNGEESENSAEALLTLMAILASIEPEAKEPPNTMTSSVAKAEDPRASEEGYVTESEALDYIAEHYEFYRRDYVYKDVKLMRLSDNKFKVSFLEAGRNYKYEDYMYDARIWNLTVNEDGTYTFDGFDR